MAFSRVQRLGGLQLKGLRNSFPSHLVLGFLVKPVFTNTGQRQEVLIPVFPKVSSSAVITFAVFNSFVQWLSLCQHLIEKKVIELMNGRPEI